VKDQLFDIVSVLAVIAYFIPITIVLINRLWKHTPFLLFASYWTLSGVVNLFDFLPGVPLEFRNSLGALYNMLDIPLMLCIFYFTSSSEWIRQFSKYACISFILIESINAYYNGINYEAIKYVVGLGVLLVLFIIVSEIIFYLRKMEHTALEKALLFIYSALLFEYGTYVIIYIFEYFIKGSSAIDNLLIYYISSLVAIIIASFGFIIKQKKAGFRRYYRSY
jgi:hypothetical protein